MKLLLILLCLLLDQARRPRLLSPRWSWFEPYCRRLCSHLGALPAPVATLVLLGLPWLAGWLLMSLLFEAWVVLGWLGALGLLFYCLGPWDLRPAVNEYLQVLRSSGAEAAEPLARRIAARGEQGEATLPGIVGALLCNAHERVFAVAFWFVVLGPLGALLYRLGAEHARLERAGACAPAAVKGVELLALLDYLPSRLLALCYALGGNLTAALGRWDPFDTLGLADNRRVLVEAGLGALNWPTELPAAGAEAAERLQAGLDAAHALLRRSFTIALLLLALLSLAGWH